MKVPQSKKMKPPFYYVTMCDMFNLLLAFYICMVAMADSRAGGLMSAGSGPYIKSIISSGKPSIGSGGLDSGRKQFPSEGWWVPDQQGDPDQLERVPEKLDRELAVHFKPHEASFTYVRDELVVRLPARIQYDADNRAVLTPQVIEALKLIADTVRRKPGRRVRVSGDVPASGATTTDLMDSAKQGQLAANWLLRLGLSPPQISLWGWGSSRPLVPSLPQDQANRSLTIEIYDPELRAPKQPAEKSGT